MTNKDIETLWNKFTDIPINPKTEKTEADFMQFKAGTDKSEIWHWFDKNYSAGIYYLLYPHSHEKLTKIENMIDERVQEELRFETDNITSAGWDFIENDAPRLCMKAIIADFDEDELNEVDKNNINTCFNKIINNTDIRIRVYD